MSATWSTSAAPTTTPAGVPGARTIDPGAAVTITRYEVAPDDLGTAILRQTTVWKCYTAGVLRFIDIESMGADHKRHALDSLRRNAETLQAKERASIARQLKAGTLDPLLFAAAMRPLESVPAPVWLEEQPLVQHLARLVPHQPAPVRGLLAAARRRWGR